MGTETRLLKFIHGHEMTLFSEMDFTFASECAVCTQKILDLHYRCSRYGCSRFRVHKDPCSEISDYVNHPFHPHSLLLRSSGITWRSCNACGLTLTQNFFYECDKCQFGLHISCFFLTPTTKQPPPPPQPNHPHPLILCDNQYKKFSYTCSYCNLNFDRLDSMVYVCLQCKILLHKSCADMPKEVINHPFHPSHPLVLHHRHRRLGTTCIACNKNAYGYTYNCRECENFDLDVICASLKPSTKNNQIIILRLRHSHPLILCTNINKLNFPNPSCYACKLPLLDSMCFCTQCNVLLHESCADLVEEINDHFLHPLHTMTLRYHKSRDRFKDFHKCRACLNYCDSFFYECSQCEWYMDIRCASLSKSDSMMSIIHPHPLAFFKEPNRQISCHACIWDLTSPFFRCVSCNFNLHVHCIKKPPPTIKSRHCHPLILTDSPIKDHSDDDEDAEFYCDACEERRELKLRSYYCKVCPYVAHLHCVVSEIKHAFEEEWSKQESNARVDEVEEPAALTMKKFLQSFEEDENKEVKRLLEDCRLAIASRNEDIFQHLDKESTKIMVDIVSKGEVKMPIPWEKWDTKSKLIQVGEYMILENMAPILKALFAKYGDFSARSNLISKRAKMLCIMVVCDVVQSMCNTKVLKITTEQFFAWFRTFMLAQCAGFETQFGFDQVKSLMHAQFDYRAHSRAHNELVKLDKKIFGLERKIKELEMELQDQCASRNEQKYLYDALHLRVDPNLVEQTASIGLL